MANGIFGGGDGSELNPFIVEDAQDLMAIPDKNNEGSYYYNQTKNIDLSGIHWIPICDDHDSAPFTGTYLGDRNEISGMVVNEDGTIGLGLFGKVYEGTIDGLIIRDSSVSGKSYAMGILAGELYGIAENISIIDCTVNGSGYATGGLCGTAHYSIFQKCEVIDVSVTGDNVVGVFCGSPNWATFTDCCAVGNAHLLPPTAEYPIQRTGAFGNTYNTGGTYTNCYSDVSISGVKTNDIGGSKWSLGMNWAFAYDDNDGLINSCYGSIDSITDYEWESDVSYRENTFIKGTDGQIYNCIYPQGIKDYHDWEDGWYDGNGPPAWYPPPFYRAKPITGELFSKYWESVIGSPKHKQARTVEQMLSVDNYVGWDFGDTWTIKKGELPRLNFPLKRAIKKCKRVPLNNYRR